MLFLDLQTHHEIKNYKKSLIEEKVHQNINKATKLAKQLCFKYQISTRYRSANYIPDIW